MNEVILAIYRQNGCY